MASVSVLSGLKTRSAVLLALCFLGFVSLGLPDGVLGVAWPSIRVSFALGLDALGALFLTTTAGYVVASFASGWLLARMSIGALLAGSCTLTAASLAGYAVAPSWSVMVAFGAFAGLGAGAIDAGINTYAARFYSARTVNLLHAFYGLGTAVGPAIMTGVLMAGFAWQSGYACVGAAQFGLAVCFALTRHLWPPARPEAAVHGVSAPLLSTLRLPVARIKIIIFFLYVGMEASAGAWVYSLLSEARGLPMAVAGAAVSIYWAALMGGRLFFGLVPGAAARPEVLLRPCIALAGAGAAILALNPGEAGNLAAIALLGFALGPVFPSLIAMTPRRLGAAHTANAVGFQIAASAVGLALLPALAGILAARFSLEIVPLGLVCLALLLLATYRMLDATGSYTPDAGLLNDTERKPL